MKNSKKKQKSSNRQESVTLKDGKPVKKFNWKLLITLIGNTLIIFGIYRLAIQFYYFEYTLVAYMAITTGLSIAYVVYNRGFSRRSVTIDMLPDTMTSEEKHAFIADGERRMKKSKWMLTIIIPLILTFTYDIIELYFADYFINLFS